MYDYFYGAESEQFTFYRIPKVLFTDERFKTISAEAKILYGLLLDRMSLSAKNGWLDGDGKVYIIFTIEDIMDAMGCADQKAGKLLFELEKKCGLIERKRQGLGKPNLIYVKNFIASSESRFLNRENHDSGEVIITDQESLKSRCSNTNQNNTDFSDTDSFPFTSFSSDHKWETKRNEAVSREQYREIIMENIAYDIILEDYIITRSTKERTYTRYVNGEKIVHTVTPVLGEAAAHNGNVIYSLDFQVTPHQLRHTYITNLIYASVDPKTVQYLAGHENSKITMDIYAKVKYNKPEQLATVINNAFA